MNLASCRLLCLFAMMEFLRVESISKQKGNRLAVDNVSFHFAKGQRLGIAGETGSGKSTLLKIISGFEQADAGTVYFNQNKVIGPYDKLIPGHPGIAYLSQHFELRNHYRVEEILEYATLLSEEKASAIFEICRVTHLLKRKTDQLSGGERQRIALVRLLVGNPSLLILDEPFSNLDMSHKHIIRTVIDDLRTEMGITCMLVSHDPLDLLSWADEIIILQDGKLIQHDTPGTVYRRPVNEYAAGLMGQFFRISGTLAGYLSGNGKINISSLLIRPEDLRVDEQSAATGKIISCRFYGYYYELRVSVLNEEIFLRTTDSTLTEGMTVPLRLSAEALISV
jgi:ABC-type sugar transport system ATPase subunit